MLFETICISGTKARNLAFHINRMKRSALELKFNVLSVLDAALRDSKISGNGVLKAKLVYTQTGELVSCEISGYAPRQIQSIRLIESDISYHKKWLDRSEIDSLFAMRKSCDEVLVVKDGLVQDTSIANIAVLVDNTWLTPKTPLLQGTCRARLLGSMLLKEADISVSSLLGASGFALLNAMTGFRRLDRVCFELDDTVKN